MACRLEEQIAEKLASSAAHDQQNRTNLEPNLATTHTTWYINITYDEFKLPTASSLGSLTLTFR